MKKAQIQLIKLLWGSVLLGLVACSAPTAEPITNTTEQTPAPTGVTEEVTSKPDTGTIATHQLTDATGKVVEVPTQPQRVVALSERDMDAAFALGAPVVGVVNGRGAMAPPAYLEPYLGDAVSVGAFSAPSPEAILALDPDLILIGGLFPALEEILPDLEQIAPVYITFNSADDWKTAFRGTAAALNMTAAAEEWLTIYQNRIETLSAQIPAVTEVSIVRFNPDGPVVMAPASFASTVITELGLSRPAAHLDIEGPGHSDTISEEALQIIDADYIFIGALNPEGNTVLEEALDNPLYAALNAFQNNQVTVVDGAVWTTLGGPLAAQTVLDEVEAALDINISAN